MFMQLTEQDCSKQPAFMYVKNYCTVKSLKLFEKKCLTYPPIFLTLTITYILAFKLNTSKIYHSVHLQILYVFGYFYYTR